MKSMLTVFFLWMLLVKEGVQAGTVVNKVPVLSIDNILDHLLRMERKQTNMSWELKSKVEKTEMQSHIKKLEEKIEILKNRTNREEKVRTITFQVRQIANPLAAGNREVLKFDDVTLNTGNAYNPKSGIFTAPVTGTYFFWANIMSRDNGEFAITLHNEGQELIRGYTGYGLRHGIATITYTTKLRKGDRVWFANEQHDAVTSIYGNRYSSYGGTLVFI